MKKLSLFTSLLFTYFIWAVDIDIANPDDFEAAAKKDIKELNWKTKINIKQLIKEMVNFELKRFS